MVCVGGGGGGVAVSHSIPTARCVVAILIWLCSGVATVQFHGSARTVVDRFGISRNNS